MFFSRPGTPRLKNLTLSVLILAPLFLFGQNNIPTGTWRTHYSFNTTISVSQSDQDVYAASKAGLFILNKSDNSISSITKLNGLSETGISVIHFNNTTNTLLIAYENGQLDLIKENVISSIPDIKLSDRFKSKISNHINEDDVFSYLSTDFGLLKINTKDELIQESYLNLSSTGDNLKIYASTIYNDSLFLATENGLMAGSLAENLKDFSKWKRFNSSLGANNETTKVLALFNGLPISGNTSQGLLLYNNGKWEETGELIGDDFSTIKTSNNTLITTSGITYSLSEDGLTSIQTEYLVHANDAISSTDNIWLADGKNGLIHIKNSSSESLYPNGPFFNEVVKLKSVDNKIFAIPDFQTNNGQPLRNNTGFSVFENGLWSNYNSTGYPQTEAMPIFLDISGVSLKSNKILFSSYGYGLLEWDNAVFSIIDESNSPLVNSSPPNRTVLIADIDGLNGNVSVLNNNTSSSLHLYDQNNSWTSYTPSTAVSDAKQVVSTPWGDQWIAINSFAGGGIVVHNSSSNEERLKSNGIGTIPSNNINQILLDKEDKIWVATSKGVVYYLFPYSIIDDPSQEAIIPIINSQLLFNNENVNCLAVDGGNRIWMGTNKGAWLFDNDGSVLVNHFTTENSPLLADVVTNIAISDISGEVFFNTPSGLISYRGTGTVIGTYLAPKIFPNPVVPGFTGVITIEGVPTNSKLKITDSSGRLVANLEANGNTAIWDMSSVYSNEIGTGVYFVFVFNEDGSSTQFGKIAIIK